VLATLSNNYHPRQRAGALTRHRNAFVGSVDSKEKPAKKQKTQQKYESVNYDFD